MYSYKRKNLPKHTVTFTVTIPWNDVETASKKAFKELSKELDVEGFRKGNAPEAIAKKHISSQDIYQKTIQTILPEYYEEIVKKEKIKPLLSPKIELEKVEEKKDWIVQITVAERPTVSLKNYKEAIKKAKSELKKSDIWVPGKGQSKNDSEAEEKNKQLAFQTALESLMKTASVEVPELLVEQEVEQRLARLVDDIRRVGLTIDSYLKSKNKTKEQLSAEFTKEVEDMYKLEFILQEIADSENIQIQQEEISKMFEGIKDPEEKEEASKNMYYYAGLLRKQKTLDYLQSI